MHFFKSLIVLSTGTCATALALGASAWAQEAAPDAGAPPDTVADAGPSADAGPNDERARAEEEAEIAAELAKTPSASNAPGAPPSPGESGGSGETSGASASSRGLSNAMNPAISAAGIVLGGGSSRKSDAPAYPDDLETGIFVQEVELRASAIVDPFFRADVSVTGNAEEIGFEEAYLTTLELPRVTLRAGLMKATVGRHNILHTHAFPFITAPLPWRALIGPEGLSDPGFSAEVLLPLPFYAELTGQVFQGEWAPLAGGAPNDPTTLVDESIPDQRKKGDFAYVGHLKTLFELGDSTTLEPGASYVGGRNGWGGFTNLVAGDLTLKWKPIEAERYLGFDWTTEYVWVDHAKAPTDERLGGGYTAVRFQFAQQWWVQARGAVLGIPKSDESRVWRGEALGAFVPSEFSALRLQYALEKSEADASPLIHEIFAQAIFSIGPHPAHAY